MATSQIAVNPVTNTTYVINVVNSNVAVVDGLTHAVSSIPPAASPHALGINLVTNKLYLADFDANMVTIFDATRHAQ